LAHSLEIQEPGCCDVQTLWTSFLSWTWSTRSKSSRSLRYEWSTDGEYKVQSHGGIECA